jgi:3-methyladenine DNA glycosylase/8-oxoguanine DNA glycosylase
MVAVVTTAPADGDRAELIDPNGPLELGAVLFPLRRGTADPTQVWEGGRGGAGPVWRGQLTPDGPATIRMHAIGPAASGGIDVRAWGPGATWSITHARELLGLDDDGWTGFDALLAERAVAGDPAAAALQRLRRRRPGLRLLRTGIVLESAVAAVLEQKVTGVEARRAWRQLIRAHGETAPGPAPEGLRILPSAEAWRRIADHQWHRAGVTPARRDTIRRVAAVEPALQRSVAVGRRAGADERLVAGFRSIPGIGAWTVAEIVQRAHGDSDTVSVGDYHLAHGVTHWFTGNRGDDAEMMRLLEPYRGHRQRVVRYIETSGVAMPRYGARITIEDHRER